MTPQNLLSLSLKQKIGQLFFIGVLGTEIDSKTAALLGEISPGGVCLFARNIKTAEGVKKLLNDLRNVSAVEPLLSLDQEGGLVDRLRRITVPMPSASAIKTFEQARILAKITCEIVRILGFNMNFAPVVDVVDEARRQFFNGLYSRTFGNSKEDIVSLSGEYLSVLQNGGCLACLKHFPGLGASDADSHEELPTINLTRNELYENDLFPYRELIKTGKVHAVMVGHAVYPKIDLQETGADGKLLPSSLSYNFVTKLLREELGFGGVIITDDLEMGAIVKNHGIGEACKMAINAGADMLAICADADAVREGFAAILKAVETGEISEERLHQSLARIAHIKSLIKPPLEFEMERIRLISEKITELNTQLNYSYGG